jgi:hypothetical protein
MKLGGEADLRINDPVVCQVAHCLGSYPLQCLRRLHYGDRVDKAAEITREAPAAGLANQPGAEFARVTGREATITDRLSQLDQRRRTQPAVQVVME